MDKFEEFCSGVLTSRGVRVSDVKSPEHRVLSLPTRNSLMDKSEEFCSGLLTPRGLRVSGAKTPEHRVLSLPIRIPLLTGLKSFDREF